MVPTKTKVKIASIAAAIHTAPCSERACGFAIATAPVGTKAANKTNAAENPT
jgi:hypothetical protein